MKRTCGLWRRAALLASAAVLLLSASAALAQEKRFFSLEGRSIVAGEPPTLGLARRSAKQGDELREQGNLDGAIAAYREAIRQAPIWQAYVALADTLALKGRLNEAIQVYRDAYYPLPEPKKADRGGGYESGSLLSFALLLSRANLYDEAITVFEHSIKENNSIPALSALKFDARRFDKPLFEAAVHLKSGYLPAFSDRASLGELYEAIRLKPDFAEAYFCLGKVQRNWSERYRDKGLRVESYAARREAHTAFRRFLALKQQQGSLDDRVSRDVLSTLNDLEEKWKKNAATAAP